MYYFRMNSRVLHVIYYNQQLMETLPDGVLKVSTTIADDPGSWILYELLWDSEIFEKWSQEAIPITSS